MNLRELKAVRSPGIMADRVEIKDALRAQIEAQVAAFEAGGGSVQQVPPGASGETASPERFRRYREMPPITPRTTDPAKYRALAERNQRKIDARAAKRRAAAERRAMT